MKKELTEVVEAARDLRVQSCPTATNPTAIRLLGSKEDFPQRLQRIALALEQLDKSGSTALDDEDPGMDAARLRTAIDHLFRWMRSHAIDVEEPYEVVASALGAPGKKPGKSFKPVPRFNQQIFKEGDIKSNPFKLTPPPGEKITLNELRKRAYKHQSIENTMGAASAVKVL